ncbi:hypothetical protein CBS101457_006634 [Exobasidium rhododendri]|nr:hypothetical protein CBS101457_006634 [Exobasidium rhododendri]
MQFRLTGATLSLALLVSTSAATFQASESGLIARGGAEVASENAKDYFTDKAKENDEENDSSNQGDASQTVTPSYLTTSSSMTSTTASASTAAVSSYQDQLNPLQAIKAKIIGDVDAATDSASIAPASGIGALSAITAATLFVFVL